MAFKMKYGKHKGFPFKTEDITKATEEQKKFWNTAEGQKTLTPGQLEALREESQTKILRR